MRRLLSAMLFEVRLQARQGFYAAYVLISAFYIIILRLIPEGDMKTTAHALITFSDPSMLGFYFVGGLVLLEKNQRILDPLMVTPLTLDEYMLSKVVSLAALSMASGAVIRFGALGFEGEWFGFLAGLFFTSVFFTLFGLGVAVRCHGVNQYFIKSTFAALVFTLPILDALNIWSTPLFYAFPSNASLLLIESSFFPLSAWEYVYSLSAITVWIAAAYVWARKSFHQFVVLKISDGRDGLV